MVRILAAISMLIALTGCTPPTPKPKFPTFVAMEKLVVEWYGPRTSAKDKRDFQQLLAKLIPSLPEEAVVVITEDMLMTIKDELIIRRVKGNKCFAVVEPFSVDASSK